MTAPLLDRSARLRDAAERIRARDAADAHVDALTEGGDAFSAVRDSLRSALAETHALADRDVRIAVPTHGPRIAEQLRALADRIEADPLAVRERTVQLQLVQSYVASLQADVEAALRGRVEAARGRSDAGLVGALRQIGLDEAADQIETALTTLDRFAVRLPRSADELRAVDEAGTTIDATLKQLTDPRYSGLVAFIQRVLAPRAPTLADIDCELLEELQASGAAANFMIRPVQR